MGSHRTSEYFTVGCNTTVPWWFIKAHFVQLCVLCTTMLYIAFLPPSLDKPLGYLWLPIICIVLKMFLRNCYGPNDYSFLTNSCCVWILVHINKWCILSKMPTPFLRAISRLICSNDTESRAMTGDSESKAKVRSTWKGWADFKW